MPEDTKPVEREAFETWARTWFDGEGEDPIFFDPAEECYSHHAVHSSWMAWDAALERAAEVAFKFNNVGGNSDVMFGRQDASMRIAYAIRALKGSH